MTLAAERVFKTAWFARASRKAGISDKELCTVVQQVILGQANDLGGGVFKKRLGKNLYRSLVVAKGRYFWVMPFCLRNRTVPTSLTTSSGVFAPWQRFTRAGRTTKSPRKSTSKQLLEICQ